MLLLFAKIISEAIMREQSTLKLQPLLSSVLKLKTQRSWVFNEEVTRQWGKHDTSPTFLNHVPFWYLLMTKSAICLFKHFLFQLVLGCSFFLSHEMVSIYSSKYIHKQGRRRMAKYCKGCKCNGFSCFLMFMCSPLEVSVYEGDVTGCVTESV